MSNNPLCVISKTPYGTHNVYNIQTNSAWTENPYGDKYAVVPDDMVEAVIATNGFLEPVFNEEGTELVSFTPLEKPVIPDEPVVDEPTTDELIDILLGRNE